MKNGVTQHPKPVRGLGMLSSYLFNLETAVECARVCRDWRARQGETMQWAYAHKAEQRCLARQARCNRAHSAVTQKVIVIEEEKVNIHAVFLMFASGQLRFLGLFLLQCLPCLYRLPGNCVAPP